MTFTFETLTNLIKWAAGILKVEYEPVKPAKRGEPAVDLKDDRKWKQRKVKRLGLFHFQHLEFDNFKLNFQVGTEAPSAQH